ncbi:ATP-dependent DNA helicase RecQ [Alkalihalophilus sp. As8PL]|uniref:ATP-dependent DNA helicase RecQ n=1 Tax=Alkalihalophilus sp. As8PL TaxID=3237103 RepID=A0AB39BTX0_9BACI
MKLERELEKWFGYPSFRPGQEEIIQAVMEEKDVLAVLPTGMGKSICYQLPALLKKGITIIVSPLLSLMEDQVQQLRSEGIKNVIAINSFMSLGEREEVLRSLSDYKLIYISPEMLQSEYIQRKLKALYISLFVVDEAHCISQWGHEFRSDYLRLEAARKQVGNPPCLAITATATPHVRKDICSYLGMTEYESFIHSVNRPNIAITVESFLGIDDKMQRLFALVESLEGPGMVYFSSRAWTEATARKLQERGMKGVNFYHGGMTNEDRLLIQQQFMHGELNVICCTSAFGMGINKNNIRFVIHFHYPTQMESYVQEVGRAGRDGEKSIAIVLFSEDDRGLARLLSQREQLSEEQIRELLMLLTKETHISTGLEAKLCAHVGCSEVAWNNVIVSLEEIGVVNEGEIRRFSIDSVADMLTKKFSRYHRTKQKQLTTFESWLHSRACRRAGLVHYFEEHTFQKQLDCCDRCGVTFERYCTQEKQKDRKPDSNDLKLNWKIELQQRLFGESR